MVGEWNLELAYSDPANADRRRNQDLAQQFSPCAQRFEVIPETECEHCYRGNDYYPILDQDLPQARMKDCP